MDGVIYVRMHEYTFHFLLISDQLYMIIPVQHDRSSAAGKELHQPAWTLLSVEIESLMDRAAMHRDELVVSE